MLNNKLLRSAGWGALIGALCLVGAILSFPFGLGALGGVLEMIGLLLTAFVFYALYLAHRASSAGLSLVGLGLVVLALVTDLVSNLNYGNTFLSNLWYFLFSLPFLIYGFLAFRGSGVPRALAVVTLLIGALLLVAGVAGFLGSQSIAESVSAFPFLLMIVWLVWLWRFFLSGKLAAA